MSCDAREQQFEGRRLVVRDDVLSAGSLPWPGRPYEATLVVDVNDASGRTIAKRSTTFRVIGPAADHLATAALAENAP